MGKPSEQDYKTADAMIEYYRVYDKFSSREHVKSAIKQHAAKKLKQQAE